MKFFVSFEETSKVHSCGFSDCVHSVDCRHFRAYFLIVSSVGEIICILELTGCCEVISFQFRTRRMATNEVSANVHDHGKAVDEQKKKAQCNYCGKVVSGFTRLKYHLAGKRGDVSACGEVPANVKELVKEKMLEFKRGNIRKEVNKLNHPDLPSKMKSSLKSNNVR